MNNDDNQKLKDELKKEIFEELRKENNKDIYDNLKEKDITEDIMKINVFINQKYKAIWFIPYIGLFVYVYEMLKTILSLDRGALRSEVFKQSFKIRYILLGLLLGETALLINWIPFMDRKVLKKSVEIVEKELQKKKSKDF